MPNGAAKISKKQAAIWSVWLSALALLIGCGDEFGNGSPSGSQAPAHLGNNTKVEPGGEPKASASALAPHAADEGWKQTAIYTFLHQPFEEAIQPTVPLGVRRPPDVTITGKSVGKLFEEVKRRWSEITFATSLGTLRRPMAKVETELGELEIACWPEIAPNHVRAFVALAEIGYYDGLFFEMRLGDRQEANLPRAIGGGSPEANAQASASIGFWLKPEILLPAQAQARGVRHKPGTVFCQWLGCFFYIGLTEAPMWDGEFVIFGEVVRNLNLAELIFDRLAEGSNPPQIRRVRIQWQDTGKALADLR